MSQQPRGEGGVVRGGIVRGRRARGRVAIVGGDLREEARVLLEGEEKM